MYPSNSRCWQKIGPEPNVLLAATETWTEDRTYRRHGCSTSFTQRGGRKRAHGGRERQGQHAHQGERERERDRRGGRISRGTKIQIQNIWKEAQREREREMSQRGEERTRRKHEGEKERERESLDAHVFVLRQTNRDSAEG